MKGANSGFILDEKGFFGSFVTIGEVCSSFYGLVIYCWSSQNLKPNFGFSESRKNFKKKY